jgi:hypothetical protein
MHKPSASFIIKGIHGVQGVPILCHFDGRAAGNESWKLKLCFVTKSETISQLATREGKKARCAPVEDLRV